MQRGHKRKADAIEGELEAELKSEKKARHEESLAMSTQRLYPMYGKDLAKQKLEDLFGVKLHLLKLLHSDLIPIIFEYVQLLEVSAQNFNLLHNALHNKQWTQFLSSKIIFGWEYIAKSELNALNRRFSERAKEFSKEGKRAERITPGEEKFNQLISKENLNIEPEAHTFLKVFFLEGFSEFLYLNSKPKNERIKILETLHWAIQILCIAQPNEINTLTSFFSDTKFHPPSGLERSISKTILAIEVENDQAQNRPTPDFSLEFFGDKPLASIYDTDEFLSYSEPSAEKYQKYPYSIMDWRLVHPNILFPIITQSRLFLIFKDPEIRKDKINALWDTLVHSPKLFNDIFKRAENSQGALAAFFDEVYSTLSFDSESGFPSNFLQRCSAQLIQILVSAELGRFNLHFIYFVVKKIISDFEQSIREQLANRNAPPDLITTVLQEVSPRPSEIAAIGFRLGWPYTEAAKVGLAIQAAQLGFNWSSSVIKKIIEIFTIHYEHISREILLNREEKSAQLKIVSYLVFGLLDRLEHKPVTISGSAPALPSLSSFPSFSTLLVGAYGSLWKASASSALSPPSRPMSLT